jgi:hypothetical protein
MSRKKPKDPNVAVPRFLAGARSIRRGLALQRDRIMRAALDAPRLLEGEPEEAINFTDVPDNDLWFYVYELGRLRDLTKTVAGWFDEPSLHTAVDELDAKIPHLRDARNRWTHVVDDGYLDWVVNFDSIVRLAGNGRVEYLVDPRHHHHDAALACLTSVEHFLRGRVRMQQEADPP